MSLLIVFLLMMIGTLGFLLLPLFRKQQAVLPRKDYDATVYRDQLAEVESDVARGLLTGDQAEAARNEIYRRALAVDKDEATEALLVLNTYFRSHLITGILIFLLVPLGSAITYFYLGSPELPAKPFAERKNDLEFIMATETEQLSAQLEAKPDVTGYAKLGDAYSLLRRFDKSIEAYQKALQLDPKNANLWSELGEAMGLAQDGMVIPEARAAFSQALRLDPQELRARFYLGLAELQNHDPRRAVAIWRDLEKDSTPDAPWMEMVRKKIAIVSQKSGFDPETIPPESPTLTAPDAAESIMSMAPADQNAMIRRMVDRLAEKLKNNPDDLDGWERLVKSYTVLGETDKAKDAQNHIAVLKAKGQPK